MRKQLLNFVILLFLVISCSVWAEESKITIHYQDYAQFELISPEGARVLIDVQNPSKLSSPATAEDLLLTTHGHWDHRNASFIKDFPGKQLNIQTGKLEGTGVKVTGIASGHNEGDEFLPEGGTNYIYIIEMAGLRIVHFGDIGQKELTSDQLKTIGEVDIALTQLSNSYSDMDINNLKGFNLMDQVKPKLIIPTHLDGETAEYAVKKWQGFYSRNTLEIGNANLDEKNPKFIMLGTNGESWGKKLAPSWTGN